MDTTIRTFIAIDLNPDIKQAIERMQSHLKEIDCNVKWVSPANIHLTLKFLNDIDPKTIDTLKRVLENLLQNIDPFKIELTQLGAFPKINDPRVLWAGLKDDKQQITQLATSLEKKLKAAGLKKDQRSFSPHITIGRVRSPKNSDLLSQAISNYSLPTGITQTVQSIALYKSTLTPEGPIYEMIRRFDFRGVHDHDLPHASPVVQRSQSIAQKSMILFSLFLFCTAVSIWSITHLTNSHHANLIKETFLQLYFNFYAPHVNAMRPPHIAGINLYFFIGGAFVLGFIILYLAKLFLVKKPRASKQSVFSDILSLMLAGYTLVIAAQTVSFLRFTQKEIHAFSGKSLYEKNKDLVGGLAFKLAEYCKKNLPGHHSSEFVTDQDITKPLEMTRHRQLAYYLYPIDIRNIRGEPHDSSLEFIKKNADSSEPFDSVSIHLKGKNNNSTPDQGQIEVDLTEKNIPAEKEGE